jgi:hypothetical protein
MQEMGRLMVQEGYTMKQPTLANQDHHHGFARRTIIQIDTWEEKEVNYVEKKVGNVHH